MLIWKDFQTVGWCYFHQMSFWDQSLRVWAAACFYEFVTNRSATPPMLTSIGYKCAIGPRGYRKPPFSHTGPAVGVQTNICRWGLIPVETSGIVLLTPWCKAFFSFWHKKQRRWWSSFSMALHAKGVWGHLKMACFFDFLKIQMSTWCRDYPSPYLRSEMWNWEDNILLLLLLYRKFYG